MSGLSLALQDAILTTLKNDAAVAAIVDKRVYDEPPSKGLVFPYITIGDGQVLGDDTDGCGDGSEVFTQVHVWSREAGYPQAKEIADAVRTALKSSTPSLDGFDVTVVEFVQMQHLRDPDGKTRHAIVEFRYLVTHLT